MARKGPRERQLRGDGAALFRDSVGADVLVAVTDLTPGRSGSLCFDSTTISK